MIITLADGQKKMKKRLVIIAMLIAGQKIFRRKYERVRKRLDPCVPSSSLFGLWRLAESLERS